VTKILQDLEWTVAPRCHASGNVPDIIKNKTDAFLAVR